MVFGEAIAVGNGRPIQGDGRMDDGVEEWRSAPVDPHLVLVASWSLGALPWGHWGVPRVVVVED